MKYEPIERLDDADSGVTLMIEKQWSGTGSAASTTQATMITYISPLIDLFFFYVII